MNDSFYTIMKVLREMQKNTKIKISRSISDFVSDVFVRLSVQPTMIGFVEHFAQIMDTSLDDDAIYKDDKKAFLDAICGPHAQSILAWIKKYPKIAGMIVTASKWELQKEMCESITIDQVEDVKECIAVKQPEYGIKIKMTTTSPLAHGGDTKAGNSTIFRRMDVMTPGGVITLPFFAGNAIRGLMRDLLADHFLKSIGIEARRDMPKVELWFFHALYAGGALEEKSKAGNAIADLMGKNGIANAEAIYLVRDTLPALSLLGCAFGNRILSGRVDFADYRPECKQWNNGNSDVSELFEWLFLTRRENHEGHEDGNNSSMIANTECIKSGVVLHGGIDVSTHISDMELSALGMGIELLSDYGYIGANANRGYGKVNIDVSGAPKSDMYKAYLSENKDKIIQFLIDMKAYIPA